MVSAPGSGRDKSVTEAQRELREARQKLRAAKAEVQENRRKRSQSTNSKLGSSRHNAVAVSAPARESSSTSVTLLQFERRLGRLAVRMKRTKTGSATIFDFGLFDVVPDSRNATQLDVQVARNMASRTGQGTYSSSVVVSTDPENPVIKQFVIRLDSPPQFAMSPQGREKVVKSLVQLVENIQPPTPTTEVWFRPVLSERGTAHSYGTEKGPLDLLTDTYPHVGSRNCPVHPTIFLDFLSDLLNAYPERLTDGRPDRS